MYIIILLLSILQSVLFWDKEPGLSVILFVLPLVMFLIIYLEKIGKVKNKKAKLITIPIVMLSATYFVFNNQFLKDLNTIVIPGLVVLMVIELICEEFTLEKVISNVLSFIFKPIGYFEKVVKNLIKKIKKDKDTEIKNSKNVKRVFKAFLISLPLVLLVLILLVTADSDFLEIFIKVTNYIFQIIDKIELPSIIGRIITILLVFLYFAGFMENVILTNDIERNKGETKQKDGLTIKMILTILNIMYLAFCIIQIKSFFNIYTMNKNNINYSYYARQGFFQLMVVSLINLITILMSKRKCYNKDKYINLMDLSMVALTAVILISSFIRMFLYEQAYGLTLLRVLVFWAEITEGILLVPTVMFVLDKKLNLAKTYFIIIVTMYVILNYANINKVIAKVNVNMYLQKESVSGNDIYYLIELGTDAVPEAIRILNIKEIPKQLEEEFGFYYSNIDFAKKQLQEKYDELNNKKTSWQEFNISKYRAKKILEEKL